MCHPVTERDPMDRDLPGLLSIQLSIVNCPLAAGTGRACMPQVPVFYTATERDPMDRYLTGLFRIVSTVINYSPLFGVYQPVKT